METKKIINILEKSPGNFCKNQNDIYISLDNMLTIPNLVKKSGKLHSLLITPYLINRDNHMIFELHYYEFEIEVCDLEKSYFVDYPKENLLSKELIDNFKPKAFVAINDFAFYERILNDYLKNIQMTSFEEEKTLDSRLENSMLYFQVF
ncbi:hypothetical protein [Fumia xinanensis]|uniref:Uncharacterized protein n=1 Tax=Fumia xinanensis TaxID=2763659 RepID=A0A926E1I0_9FIRM|nr:hypothetical protein [Fumia xinanensis]MBC8559581.1 hypothetical protein [Fumia xinanensis]